MQKVILVFGVLAGAIVSLFMLVMTKLCAGGAINLDNSELLGYGGMVIALSMIFFGVKSYRDNYQNGALKFGKGLQVGMLITLVATLLYTATGEAYYQLDPEGQAALMDKYAEHHLNKMKVRNALPAEIEQKAQEFAELKVMHQKPALRLVMTVAIILPVGVIIALFSATLLRKKEFLRG